MIIFKTLIYKNLLAVGNSPIEVSLNSHKTTLISGKNGAGKSTILSALCFSLFGRAYTDINKNQLINSINQKQCWVQIQFSIGNKAYKVIRGIKPNIFEIYEDDKLIPQSPDVRDYQKILEQQILKMNFRMFTQIVIMGSSASYTPFMRLKSNERREFIEDLLDIRVFTHMNKLLKEKRDATNTNIKDISSELKSTKEKVALQQSFITRLKEEKEVTLKKLNDDIVVLKDTNDVLQNKVTDILATVEKKMAICEKDEIAEMLSDLKSDERALKTAKTKRVEKKDTYNEIDTCPTCFQKVGDELKSKITKVYDDEINKADKALTTLQSKITSLTEKLKVQEEIFEEITSLNNTVTAVNKDIHANNTLISRTNSQIATIEKDTTNVDEEISKQKALAKEYMVLEKQKRTLTEQLQYAEFVSSLLQDTGIKSKIIAKYIPTINKLVNAYLAAFDFFVMFNLDEGFNEQIKSRHRDLFSYSSFSEGQKLRIDVALMLAWREIARQKNSVHCNILICDEIDAVVDLEGSEQLMSLLRTTSVQNLFLISHKDLSNLADRSIMFVLKDNFTEMTLS